MLSYLHAEAPKNDTGRRELAARVLFPDALGVFVKFIHMQFGFSVQCFD